jgi:serine O-acetyltransferase
MQVIMRFYRLSHWFHRRNLRFCSRIVDVLTRFFFAASIPGRATIGRNVFFHHSGLGVVINGRSVIEDGCEIGVHVVLGGRAPVVGAPHIERNVILHAGSQVIGPVRIGAGSVVAANSTVLSDMPGRALIAGSPASAKRTDLDVELYRHDAPQRADEP